MALRAARGPAVTVHPAGPHAAYTEEVVVVAYGAEVGTGASTASGELYRDTDYTAAHARLPVGPHALIAYRALGGASSCA